MEPTFQQHLQNGINRMLPFVVAGALFAAFLPQAAPGTFFADLLRTIGPEGGLALMLPILAGFIAQSIAGWDGLLPGAIGGLLATRGGSGMLGGILAGYLAGYITLAIAKAVRLPKLIEDLKPILILPALTTLAVGAVMALAINPPASWLMRGLQGWLTGLQGQSSILFGLILGAMCAFDMGGPVNKAAALFALDLLAVGIAEPLGACVAGVMVPALGLNLAMRLSPRRFTDAERQVGTTALLLGLFNIGEGTIPLALKDPGRHIPAITLGGAVAGGIAMAAGVGVRLPVGGFFTMLLPGMVTGAVPYLIAIAVGTVVAALTVNLLKPVRQ